MPPVHARLYETGDLLRADSCWTDGCYERAVNLVMLNSCLPGHPSWRGEEQQPADAPATTGPSPGHASVTRFPRPHASLMSAQRHTHLSSLPLRWPGRAPGERSAQIRRWFLVARCPPIACTRWPKGAAIAPTSDF